MQPEARSVQFGVDEFVCALRGFEIFEDVVAVSLERFAISRPVLELGENLLNRMGSGYGAEKGTDGRPDP